MADTLWQPIETAPKDGTKIDLSLNGSRLPKCRWVNGRDDAPGFWMYNGVPIPDEWQSKISHWMSIPEPPSS